VTKRTWGAFTGTDLEIKIWPARAEANPDPLIGPPLFVCKIATIPKVIARIAAGSPGLGLPEQ
jgi:hypothetical protein